MRADAEPFGGDLAKVIYEHVWGEAGGYPLDEAVCCADAVLGSDWFRQQQELVWNEGWQASESYDGHYAVPENPYGASPVENDAIPSGNSGEANDES